jgi:hypothetical protein
MMIVTKQLTENPTNRNCKRMVQENNEDPSTFQESKDPTMHLFCPAVTSSMNFPHI